MLIKFLSSRAACVQSVQRAERAACAPRVCASCLCACLIWSYMVLNVL